MVKKEYDAIVVGGGNNGLCLAAYLQRAGMEVAIFERRHEEGGCICTRETTAPGFMHNHAVCMEFMDWMPFLYDFGLEKLGARTIHPDAEFGIPFSDGSPPIILYGFSKKENYERTHKSISVYSKKDADTWVELLRKVQAMQLAQVAEYCICEPFAAKPDEIGLQIVIKPSGAAIETASENNDNSPGCTP